MERVDQRKVRAITEQTTRNALNEQQLNEWAALGRGLSWAGRGLARGGGAMLKGGKNFFTGAGAGLAGRAGRSLGFGARNAKALIPQLRNDVGMYKTFLRNNPGNKYFAQNAAEYGKKLADAERLVANSARAKNIGLGLGAGGVLGVGLAGGPSSSPAYSDPQTMVDPMFQSNNPYAGYGGGYGGMDPYAAYGGVDPYAAYYSGAYSDPYAAYYSGAYSDPYAAYYGGAYSNPYGGGGSSSNNMDLATMMAIMNQGGDSSTLPMMMAMNGGNIDDQTLQMMMMMNQGGGNDIWGLGGYHA